MINISAKTGRWTQISDNFTGHDPFLGAEYLKKDTQQGAKVTAQNPPSYDVRPGAWAD